MSIEAMIVSVRAADPRLNFVGSQAGMNDYWLETVRLIQLGLETGLIVVEKITTTEKDSRGKEHTIEEDHVEIKTEKLRNELARRVSYGFASYMSHQDIISQASLKGVPEKDDY